MSINSYKIRYAHAEGHTDLCFANDGKSIITCGSDGDIRIWSCIDDEDPGSHSGGKIALCVAQKGDSIYVGSDDGTIDILKYPDGERNGILTRFTAPATQICVTDKEFRIACISEDSCVKLFTSPEDTASVSFADLQGPALGVAISPDNRLLCATGGDSHLYIWDIADKTLVKRIDNIVTSINNFGSAKELGRVSFHPSRKQLAYPHKQKIIIISTQNFEICYTLSDKSVDANCSFTIVKYSPCGSYLAAATTNGDICIWNATEDGVSVSQINKTDRYRICAMSWNPSGSNEICFCDVSGQLGSLIFEPNEDITPSIGIEEELLREAELDDKISDNDSVTSRAGSVLSNSDGTIVSGGDLDDPISSDRNTEKYIPVSNLQSPFQPGASPLNYFSRILVNNDIGTIRVYEEEFEPGYYADDTTVTYEVTFHDQTVMNSYTSRHVHSIKMAALATTSYVLATSTYLQCMPLPHDNRSNGWQLHESEDEEILCVANSSKLVIVATDKKILRIFSTHGIQLKSICIPGPVVAVSAFENTVFVVYYSNTSADEHQMAGMVLKNNGFKFTCTTIPVPIAKNAVLRWCGFSDLGSYVVYDSTGMINICAGLNCPWIPSCDTTKLQNNISDYFELTSVSEINFQAYAINCRGKIYPPANPMPILKELALQVPTVNVDRMEAISSQFEEKLQRLVQFEKNHSVEIQTTAFKLFCAFVKANKDERAVELIGILQDVRLCKSCMNYLKKSGNHHLVAKLQQLNFNDETVSEEVNENIEIQRKPLQILKRITKTPVINESKNVSNFAVVKKPEVDPIFTPMDTQESYVSTPDISIKISQERSNPFVKTKTQTRNLLSVLDEPNKIETVPEKSVPEKIVVEKSVVNKSEVKTPQTQFKEWFKENAHQLEEQYPNLSVAELARKGLALFKSTSEATKRKATIELQEQRTKQAKLKLSAFAATKK